MTEVKYEKGVQDLKAIQAIDTMNRPTYFSHEVCKDLLRPPIL